MDARLAPVLDAQRALLAPVALGGALDGDAWASRVTDAIRAVAGCDHTLFLLPSGPGDAVRVYSDDTDPAVGRAFEAAAAGAWGGTDSEPDELLATAASVRQRGGAGAYHERDLGPRAAVERSPFFREALAPYGLRHVMGIAVPLPDGREVSVAAFYERPDAPGFTDATLADLSLLVPAFDAGVQAYLRYGPEATARRAGFTVAIDALGTATLVLDEDGAEVHWNAALVRLLAPEADDGRLLGRLRQWARHLAAPSRTGRPSADVCGAEGRYRVVGTPLGHSGLDGVGALVTVERLGLPLPHAEALRQRFGLTRREVEVARHLARGVSDRALADTLSIAHATARRHTESVLRKLGVGSRAAVASRLCEPAIG